MLKRFIRIWNEDTGTLIRPVIVLFVLSLISFYLSGILVQLRVRSSYRGYAIDFSPSGAFGLGASHPLLGLLVLSVLAMTTYLFYRKIRPSSSAYYEERNIHASKTGIKGTACIMGEAEMARKVRRVRISDTDMPLLGREMKGGMALIYDPDDKTTAANSNMCVAGASGTGKSRKEIVPHLLQIIKAGESAVVTDPKGEIYEDTARIAKSHGYKVRVLNILDCTHSDGCNFFSIFDYDLGDVTQVAQTLTSIIVENTKAETNFFTDVTQKIILATMLRVVDGPPIPDGRGGYKGKTLKTLYECLALGLTALQSLLQDFGVSHPARKLVDDFFSATDNVKESARQGATTMLQSLMSPMVGETVSHDDIDFDLPGHEKCLYFVVVPIGTEGKALNWLAALFYQCLLITLMRDATIRGGKLALPVNLIFEEFPNIFRIPNFKDYMNTLRGYGFKVTILFQNIEGMEEAYPHGAWNAIVDACGIVIFMGTNTTPTAEYFSKKTGVGTFVNNRATYRRNALYPKFDLEYTESTGLDKRELYTPDEIMKVGEINDRLVFISRSNVLPCLNIDKTEHPLWQEMVGESAMEHVPLYRSGGHVSRKNYFKKEAPVPGNGSEGSKEQKQGKLF